MKKFSLVSTVFNEISRINITIHDIENQTLKPSEIIITDAGSNDGTFKRLNKWAKDSSIKIKILQKNRVNVAEGRNFAISEAENELIVSTDFGCRFAPQWLHSLILPFEDPAIKVTGGNYSVNEEEIQTLPAKGTYIICNGYSQTLNENFIPSSRSIAYYKNVWKEIGGYPEWLTLAGDDLVFGKMLMSKGYKIHLVHEPYVFWGRHKEAKAYSKEAFRYGLGDGEAGLNQRSTFTKTVETLGRYLFILITVLILTTILKPHLLIILPLLVTALISFRSYYWSFKNWLKLRSPKYNFTTLLYSFYLIELSRWHYLHGYIKGYFFSPELKKQESIRLKEALICKS
jgi:cellulose synthase/poly-beta-1,6-N-acetylglucosamine synthase-like glycosyltransferase